jgi:threonylcarbamoyladenosine tRNA methylthiotransferase MtaB
MCASIGFAWIHAFPYSPRPGTAAWNMKPRVPERIAGERVRILTELAHKNRAAYEDYWVGRTLSGIVERGPDALREHVVTGNYLTLAIPPTGLPKGKSVMVKVEGKGTAILVKSR